MNPDEGAGAATVHISVIAPDSLVESSGVPYLITEEHGVKLDIIRPGSAAMLFLSAEEAITLGKELFLAGREARRNHRKDTATHG